MKTNIRILAATFAGADRLLTTSGKFSVSKTFGPWALAIACPATMGRQTCYVHPYAPS